jgi:hypothetical protein
MGCKKSKLHEILLFGNDGVIDDPCGFVEDKAQLAVARFLVAVGSGSDEFDKLDVIWPEDPRRRIIKSVEYLTCPICETSKSPQDCRQARCSFRTPIG